MPDAKFNIGGQKPAPAALKAGIKSGLSSHAALAKAQPLVSKVKV